MLITERAPIIYFHKHSMKNFDFFFECALKNEAAIFDVEFTDGWISKEEWVIKESGKPNLTLLTKLFGTFFIHLLAHYW